MLRPIALLVLASFTPACVGARYTAPRTLPERVLPATLPALEASLDGDGATVIDAVDGPARVGHVVGYHDVPRSASFLVPQVHTSYGARGTTYTTTYTQYTRTWTERQRTIAPLCSTTPCVARLPLGRQTLVFEDGDIASDAIVDIGPGPTAIRHALTLRRDGTDVWGATLVMWALGAVAMALGPAIALYEQSSLADHSTIGWGITAGGGAVFALGAFLLGLNQEALITPGATTQWALQF